MVGGIDRNEHTEKIRSIFLQETHSDKENEINWALWWKGQYILFHGTNFSAGVAIPFSPGLSVNIVSTIKIVTGRAFVVRAKVQDISFCFFNIYAPNQDSGRQDIFQKIKKFLKQCNQSKCVVMGGDWNCSTNTHLH